MTTPLISVCVSEHLAVDATGVLRMAPWAVPRVVADVRADSRADGPLLQDTTLPGKLLIDQKLSWRNDTPVDHDIRIYVTRRYKHWIVSNPNAVQFRDRWSTAVDAAADEPITSSIFMGQTGSATDVGTNTVAEPNPGVYWNWWGTTAVEDWEGPITPGQTFNLWYRAYVWTPPPFSNNANKNRPVHWSEAGWTRILLEVFPLQGDLVTG